MPELLGDPALKTLLGDRELQDPSPLGARLPERRGLLDVLADEREHGVGRRISQIGAHGLDIGGLPTAFASLVRVPPPVDILDDDQARVAEKASCVAERDGALTGRVQRARHIDRLCGEMPAEPRKRRLDFGAVAACQQVHRLVGNISHRIPSLTVSADSKLTPIGLDDDTAVEVCSVDD